MTVHFGVRKPLNLLMLYNPVWSEAAMPRPRLDALQAFSRHRLFFLAAAAGTPASRSGCPDLSIFDGVIWDFTLPVDSERAWSGDCVDPEIAAALVQYDGLKMLLLQESRESVEAITDWAAGKFLTMVAGWSGPDLPGAQITALPAKEDFSRWLDDAIDDLVPAGPRAEIISAPIMAGASGLQSIIRKAPFEFILNDGILHGVFQRRDLESVMADIRDHELPSRRRQSAFPPVDAVTTGFLELEAAVCRPEWARAGSSIVNGQLGMQMSLPPTAWQYAAALPIEIATDALVDHYAWARLDLADVTAPFRIGVYDPQNDEVSDEADVPVGNSVMILPLREAGPRLILFRTGEAPVSSQVLVRSVQLLMAWAYRPDVVEAARQLARKWRSARS